MDPMLAMIIIWPVSWAPNGWQFCNGQSLNLQQYEALYSLIGVTYGGNGSTTFNLPNLCGKIPMGSLTGTDLNTNSGKSTSSVAAVGTGSVALTTANLPSHTHAATFSSSGGSTSVSIAVPADPVGVASGSATMSATPSNQSVLSVATGSATATPKIYNSTPVASSMTTLKPFSVNVPAGGGSVTNANTGQGTAVPINVAVPVTVSTLQPSITLNFIIAVQGLYPDRPN